jgi:hypothetical protein
LDGYAHANREGASVSRQSEWGDQLTLNQRVPGSSPGAPTKLWRRISLPVLHYRVVSPSFTILGYGDKLALLRDTDRAGFG